MLISRDAVSIMDGHVQFNSSYSFSKLLTDLVTRIT